MSKIDFSYGISKGGRCMIADDMGLGKTIQALGIAYYYKASWPLLIVVPSSVRYISIINSIILYNTKISTTILYKIKILYRFQWSEAIYEFLPSIPTQYIHHFANTKDYIADEKITIISYDLLNRAIDVFEKHMYGFVILVRMCYFIHIFISMLIKS